MKQADLDRLQAIDDLLPQTQCGECGSPGCKPYAQAIVDKQAPIHRCVPGGVQTLVKLAELVGEDPAPYMDEVARNTRKPQIAHIKEAECIGCTKCIQACPVDAIIGCAKHMHTIIIKECTGCGLCVEPCPVDCIVLDEVSEIHYDKNKAKARFEYKNIRMQQNKKLQKANYLNAKMSLPKQNKALELNEKKSYIQAALARVKAKKGKLSNL